MKAISELGDGGSRPQCVLTVIGVTLQLMSEWNSCRRRCLVVEMGKFQCCLDDFGMIDDGLGNGNEISMDQGSGAWEQKRRF